MEEYERLCACDKGKLEEYFYTHCKLWNNQTKAKGSCRGGCLGLTGERNYHQLKLTRPQPQQS